jgi:hypothetical protein
VRRERARSKAAALVKLILFCLLCCEAVEWGAASAQQIAAATF